MKKILAMAMSICMAFGVASSLAACGGYDGDTVRLAYGTGENSKGDVNGELYWKNDRNTVAADPCITYVSEEQDEEYGGWYYTYCSGQMTVEGRVLLAFPCFRSKDLSSWESVGEFNGYALRSVETDWTLAHAWAPEVIYHEQTDKYYMYYSAAAGNGDRSYVPASYFDLLTLAVAVSDTPVGPFTLVRSGIDANGEEIENKPRFNVKEHFGLEKPFAAIDASPFIDDNGDIYVYFAKHEDTSGRDRGIWGIKMKDPVTPDFSTLSCVTIHNMKSVQHTPGHLADDVVPVGVGDFPYEGALNEGPHMVKYNGKYYMTYSAFGYGDKGYNVMQAISDNPLTGFVKPDMGMGNPVISAPAAGISYMAGTGHHSMVWVGDELFTCYAHHTNPASFGGASDVTRILGVDRLAFAELGGQTVLVGNGPTFTPQYKATAISGYRNVAKDATITVSNGTGAEFLNDGLLSVSGSLKDREFISTGAVTITLTFDTPVAINSVMVYNSAFYEYGFTKVDEILFHIDGGKTVQGKNYPKGVIQNLVFPEKYVDREVELLHQGAAVIADFAEISVTQIQITVSDKYLWQDLFGETLKDIGVSEIVVLGK